MPLLVLFSTGFILYLWEFLKGFKACSEKMQSYLSKPIKELYTLVTYCNPYL